MTHISEIDNNKYDIMNGVSPENNASYDIIFIMKYPSDEEEDNYDNGGEYVPEKLIGWYLGEYDFDVTEEYIKKYCEKQ